jgi:hypothetical protein
MPLICPTRQAPKICSAHRLSIGNLGRWSAQANDSSDRKEAVDVFRRYRARDPVRPVLCGRP